MLPRATSLGQAVPEKHPAQTLPAFGAINPIIQCESPNLFITSSPQHGLNQVS